MSQEAKTSRSLVFSDVKAAADVETVLDYIGLLDGLTERGEELVGYCPLGSKRHGKKDSFAINAEKKAYQCFACKGKGSILDLVANVCELHIRDAADLVDQITSGNLDVPDDEEAGEGTQADNPKDAITIDAEPNLQVSLIYRRFARLRDELDDLELVIASLLKGEEVDNG